jgi:hypothetical protein
MARNCDGCSTSSRPPLIYSIPEPGLDLNYGVFNI